jgi:hypothetical protein
MRRLSFFWSGTLSDASNETGVSFSSGMPFSPQYSGQEDEKRVLPEKAHG